MNLQVCSNGHDEITYYGAYKDCPFCKYIKEQDDKDREINRLSYLFKEVQEEKLQLEKQYEDKCEECEILEDKISDLEDEINGFKI